MALPTTTYDRVMASSSYTTQKARSDARLAGEKDADDRRKNILVLVYDHLLSYGYLDAAERLSKESGLPLSNWNPADNVDLLAVVHDYESFFEMRFGRKPKLARRSTAPSTGRHQAVAHSGGEELSRPNIPPSMAKLANAAQAVSSPVPRRPASAGTISRMRHPRDEPVRTTVSPARGDGPVYVGPGGNNSGGVDGDLTVTRKVPSKRDAKMRPPVSGKSAISTSASANSVEKEDASDLYEAPSLKPLPEAVFPGEFRDMALSIQREIVIESPDVQWSDVKGLEDAKRIMNEAVNMPLKYPKLFTGVLSPWYHTTLNSTHTHRKGLLLFGPPGTGKTMLAKAVASQQSNVTFFNISASAIVSKWRGESEKLARVMFELARYHAPSVIFIDEIDALMSARDQQAEHEGSRRLKTELLIQIDGLTRANDDCQVFVLAASNLPWDLDHALLRRLEKRIYVPFPNLDAREAMLKHHLSSTSIHPHDSFYYGEYARQLVGYSGSDIRILCKEASMQPVRRLMARLEAGEMVKEDETGGLVLDEIITDEDFKSALSVTRPSTKSNTEKAYMDWMARFGSV